MRKIMKLILFAILFLILVFFIYFFIGNTKKAEDIVWGVNFSQKHTQNFGMDWQEVYLALLDDLGAKRLKIAVHWDMVEPEKDEYYFDDLDWQIEQAKEREAKILLVIGMKTPRWPECHLPYWAVSMSKEDQQTEILKYLEKIVSRYSSSQAIWAWQVENEPFFPFGDCPWIDRDFLKKEIELVKSFDEFERPVLISDSGEISLWIRPAKMGDIVGVTLYQRVWFHEMKNYVTYPFPPVFYWRKAMLIDKFFGKEVICVELQAEPWGPKLLYDSPLEEQEKTMDLEQFRKNIEFAKKTGLDTFYLWGGEWWYWMKEKHNNPQFWNEAKKLF